MHVYIRATFTSCSGIVFLGKVIIKLKARPTTPRSLAPFSSDSFPTFAHRLSRTAQQPLRATAVFTPGSIGDYVPDQYAIWQNIITYCSGVYKTYLPAHKGQTAVQLQHSAGHPARDREMYYIVHDDRTCVYCNCRHMRRIHMCTSCAARME